METMVTHNRAQVGIGTLIVFIAMVLVAAIAAGVFITSAGSLQSQSEDTSERSSTHLTNRVQVVSKTGEMIAPADIGGISIDLTKAPGAGDIDVGNVTVQWIGPGGSTELTSPGGPPCSFCLSANSGTTPVLESESDVFTLLISLDANTVDRHLNEGEAAMVRIITPSGGTTSVSIRAPNVLEPYGDVPV